MDLRSQDWIAGAARFRFVTLAALVIITACTANETPGLGGAGTVGVPTQPTAGSMGLLPVAGAGGSTVPVPIGGAMPCAVDSVVKSGCQTCHGATPIGGAPMSLVSVADFQRDYAVKTTPQLSGRTMKMYELARIRLNREMGTTPMPQGRALAADQMGTLNSWLMGGAPAGSACTVTGGAGTGTAGAGGSQQQGGSGGVIPTGGMGGTEPDGPANIEDQCTKPGAFDPLVAELPNETCYDFRSHGRSGVGDTSKFSIPVNETYNQFYFEIPWEAGAVATRFGSDFDNIEVLHHWLMFGQTLGMAPGTVEPGVLGTTLFTDAELIAGWAVGGCTTKYPDNVGVRLPSTGVIMLQWHHYNFTGSTATDSSAAQICVVPGGSRPNTAGLTFLGTEVISVPAGMIGEGAGTCTNDSNGPITIIAFTPHMHEIGINMKSVVTRMGGGAEENVFDMPFQFDYQTNYMMNPPVVLQPGDRIESTCTWQNESAVGVGFGQSTKSEMCYQFALSYPYPALNNGVPSLIGATNTCW